MSAVLKLKRGDCSLQGKRARLRLHEKGGKEKLVWLHHEAEQFLDAFLEAANINENDATAFQTLNKNHRLTGEEISRRDMLRIAKERCAAAELPESICNYTFRRTGITVFLQNGGSLEAAQDMANHSDPRTMKLYDRRKDLATFVRSRGELRSSKVLRQLPDRIRISFSFCRLFATRQRVFKETWHHSRIYSEAVIMACRVTQPFR